MRFPLSVHRCIDALESAGFEAYAVGGCVRDVVLGRIPHDYDLCTSALPEQIQAVFAEKRLVLAGVKHGTVGVVTEDGVVEITTYRTEGDYRDHRHPEWVQFVPEIEKDLARRDFTVNAMAYSPTRGFADPFGGQEDLKNHCLRAVGCPSVRFQEDALRIIRGIRFAVRFSLRPEVQTWEAMHTLAPLMQELAKERIFDELCKLLPLMQTEDLLVYRTLLGEVIPELIPSFDFDQYSPHHAYDVYRHTAQVVANVGENLTLRWAALLHDIGKPSVFTLDEDGRGHFLGHGEKSTQMAEEILYRLKAPTALRKRVAFLIGNHMIPLKPDKKLLRHRLNQFGQEAVWQLLCLQRADFRAKKPIMPMEYFEETERVLKEVLSEESCFSLKDLAISGSDLIALGYQPGKEIGVCLNRLLQAVLDEEIPNTRQALLQAVSK